MTRNKYDFDTPAAPSEIGNGARGNHAIRNVKSNGVVPVR